MKRIFTLALSIFLSTFCAAQFVTIPDQNFKNFLMSRYPTCFNAGGEMDTTCAPIISEDSLSAPRWNLLGIQYFDNLIYLDASYCELTNIPLPATLKHLNNSFSYAQGSGLNIMMPPFLEWLDVSQSGYSDVSVISFEIPHGYFPNSLKFLNLENNYLFSPSSGTFTWPTSLISLNASGNCFSDLGILPTSLDTLRVAAQQPDRRIWQSMAPTLTTLAVPQGLRYLNCSENSLTRLTLPVSLTWLDCSENLTFFAPMGNETPVPQLTSLGVLPPALEYLNCSQNSLSNLGTLPASLKYLDCSQQKYWRQVQNFSVYDTYENAGIVNLRNLPPSLQYLNAGDNALDTLYRLPVTLRNLTLYSNTIEHLPELPAGLTYLDVGYTQVRCLPELPASMGGTPLFTGATFNLRPSPLITCLPNVVPGIRVEGAPLFPVCTILNNPNGCIFNPVATGIIFYDNNNNGLKDVDELPRAGVKVSVDNGEMGFTDLNGKYALACAVGTNTLTVTPPPYFNPVPSSFNYTLSSSDTLVREEIALQANASVDSIRVSLLPWITPRPGFKYGYHVKYENVGTTSLNTSINITYPDTQLEFLSSSNPSVVQSGSTLSLAAGLMSPGSRGEFTVDFTVLASLGETVSTTATALSPGIVGGDVALDVVQGSFDPNDKNATLRLSPSDVLAGKFIDYLVRFQNTGTDTAFRVYVTDTLSHLLQYESFEMIEASHACKTLIDSIYVSFEFENILLPDSNVNERASHGYARFRIKPLATLALDDEVTNNASIYFDYNVAVETNTAVTTIAQPAAVFALLDFGVSLQPQNNVRLQWTTQNEQQVSRFIVLESIDGTNRYPVDTIVATGGASQNYSVTRPVGIGTTYYWLQTIDNSGASVFSNRISVTVTTIPTNPPLTTTVRSNPVRGTLYFDVADATLMNTGAVLINSEGRIVKRFLINASSVTVNVADLAAGVYYLRTKTDTRQVMIIR